MGSDTIGAKQSGHYKCPLYYEVAGCPLLRGLECIEVYGDTIWIFRIVRYITGVRSSGVSVKNISGVPKILKNLMFTDTIFSEYWANR